MDFFGLFLQLALLLTADPDVTGQKALAKLIEDTHNQSPAQQPSREGINDSYHTLEPDGPKTAQEWWVTMGANTSPLDQAQDDLAAAARNWLQLLGDERTTPDSFAKMQLATHQQRVEDAAKKAPLTEDQRKEMWRAAISNWEQFNQELKALRDTHNVYAESMKKDWAKSWTEFRQQSLNGPTVTLKALREANEVLRLRIQINKHIDAYAQATRMPEAKVKESKEAWAKVKPEGLQKGLEHLKRLVAQRSVLVNNGYVLDGTAVVATAAKQAFLAVVDALDSVIQSFMPDHNLLYLHL